MLLLGIWHNNYNLRYVSTTHVQFTFSAGTVFVLSAIQDILLQIHLRECGLL